MVMNTEGTMYSGSRCFNQDRNTSVAGASPSGTR
jgi:hypothetical protein